jgi:protein gp37
MPNHEYCGSIKNLNQGKMKMGENSKIEWCDHTFNPWIGCQKVSPGCDHCYAEAMMNHRYGKVEWGPHGERKRTSDVNWKKARQMEFGSC